MNASAVRVVIPAKVGALRRQVLHGVLRLRRAVGAALEHDVLNLAQATAYSAVFALFPALIVSAAVLSLMPGSFPLRTQMSSFFRGVVPENISPLLDGYFTRSALTQHAQRVLAVSVVVSLTGGSSVMTTLMEGFRRAHNLPLLKGNFWWARVRALLLVPLSLMPMAAASVLVVFGHILTHAVAESVTSGLRRPVYVAGFLLRWMVALAGSVGIIGVIYHLGTDLSQHVREQLEPLLTKPWKLLRADWSWSASLPGAAVATVLWFVSTLLFGVYVTRFADYSRVYGSLGAAVALLFWLFLIAVSVLLGAEFNAQGSLQKRDPHLSELLWKLPGLRTRKTGRITD